MYKRIEERPKKSSIGKREGEERGHETMVKEKTERTEVGKSKIDETTERRKRGRRAGGGGGWWLRPWGRRAQEGGSGRCKIVPAAQSQENRSRSPVCRTPAQHSLPFLTIHPSSCALGSRGTRAREREEPCCWTLVEAAIFIEWSRGPEISRVSFSKRCSLCSRFIFPPVFHARHCAYQHSVIVEDMIGGPVRRKCLEPSKGWKLDEV